jgi:hypothetical protein
MSTAKRTKRAAAPIRPKMSNEQLTALLVAGIDLSKKRNYNSEHASSLIA